MPCRIGVFQQKKLQLFERLTLFPSVTVPPAIQADIERHIGWLQSEIDLLEQQLSQSLSTDEFHGQERSAAGECPKGIYWRNAWVRMSVSRSWATFKGEARPAPCT